MLKPCDCRCSNTAGEYFLHASQAPGFRGMCRTQRLHTAFVGHLATSGGERTLTKSLSTLIGWSFCFVDECFPMPLSTR
jgi:hypothetical protein